MNSLIIPYLPEKMRQNKTTEIYEDLLSRTCPKGQKPHQFVRMMMEAYGSLTPQPDRSVHGRYFEYVIGETLAQQGIEHLYFQVELLYIPLAVFDWFLYHPTHPVSVSCKTKARDRWKQAAYEAMALKRVYTQATNYLVTIEELTAAEEKKKDAPQTIDHFVVATEPEYSDAVKHIAEKVVFRKAADISPIRNGTLLIIGDEKPPE